MDYSKLKKDDLIAELEKRDEQLLLLEESKNDNIKYLENELKEKTLDVVDSKDLTEKVNDVEIFGNPDTWELICKASSKNQGRFKLTKAMEIRGLGLLVQVSTQQGDNVAEALQFMPNCIIGKDKDGNKKIIWDK